jgi:organic hydroperoxide reductase OsmC/OhrA
MTIDQSATARATHEDTFTIELVWDADQDATAVPWQPPWQGSTIQVGPKAGWLPAHLVTLAAASGFMSTLLQLAEAAGVSILGYVSISKLHVPTDRRSLPTITLTPCIVVASADAADKVAELCRQASEVCEVCRALQGRIQVAPDTQVITPGAEGSVT